MRLTLLVLCLGLLEAAASENELTIHISTGKSKYVLNEPVYFKIILQNNSDRFLGYNSPLSIGLGSFTFCEAKTGACVQDTDPFEQPLEAPVVGNLATGRAYRVIGTLNAKTLAILIGEAAGEKQVFVKPSLMSDSGLRTVSSPSVRFTIVAGSPEDDSLLVELRKKGVVSLSDNASGTRIFPFTADPLKPNDKLADILDKHRDSHLFPYLLSYSGQRAVRLENKKGNPALRKQVLESYREQSSLLDGADPYLKLLNQIRCLKGESTQADPELKSVASKCRSSVNKALNGTGFNGLLKEKNIPNDKIEDFDLVKKMRPDLFSKELDSFLANGSFDIKWKEKP